MGSRIYAACDLEGVAGVVDHDLQCCWDARAGWFAPYLGQARRLATLELNALVEGAIAAGVDEVVAWDGHGGFPGGIDPELLHPSCRLVMGAGEGGPEGLDPGFAGLFQTGMHAMAGTPRAVLPHSFHGGLEGYWVDGEPVGEIWMNCYTAGLQGVPFVFLSGDRAAASEASKLAPWSVTVAVKEGLGGEPGGLRQAPAVSMSPAGARQAIREGVERAVHSIGSARPFTPSPPFTVRARFVSPEAADGRETLPGVRRIDSVTVEACGADRPWILI